MAVSCLRFCRLKDLRDACVSIFLLEVFCIVKNILWHLFIRGHTIFWAENQKCILFSELKTRSVYCFLKLKNRKCILFSKLKIRSVYYFLSWKPGSVYYFLSWKPRSVNNFMVWITWKRIQNPARPGKQAPEDSIGPDPARPGKILGPTRPGK